jgi:hypothetical protein
VFIVLGLSALFYLLIPGIGAISVRRRWQLFRMRVLSAAQSPPVTYEALHRRELPSAEEQVKAVGTLESIQGEHILWVRGEKSSIAVDMSKSAVYVLSQRPAALGSPPVRTSWSRIGSLPEGSQVLVSGILDTSGGHPVIRSSAETRVLALFFDGPAQSLLRNSIWSGRQLNEYWNSVTPSSLAGGTLSLLLFGYFLLRGTLLRGVAQLAISLATVPILPLLPPGVVLFYLYRVLWRRARRLRAFRDVLHLAGGGHLVDTRVKARLRHVDEKAFLSLKEAGVHAVEPTISPMSTRIFFCDPASARAETDDPLAEPLLVRGDPREEATNCQRRARLFEMLAAVTFVAGLLINFALALVGFGVVL